MIKIKVALFIAAAFVDAVAVNKRGAIHIYNEECGLGDGNAEYVLAKKHRVVISRSGNGNLVCMTDVTPPPNGKARHFNFDNTGLLCQTANDTGPAGRQTKDWLEVVTPSGKAILTCHSKRD